MRIISGMHKGRRITAPRQLPVRPTTDMAKEALFNILHHTYDFQEIQVLDLYAGTGNISYEFASRGCEKIVAIDSSHHCIRFIEATSKALEFPISTVKSDALHYLEKSTQKFGIIFADPPYDRPQEEFLKIRELVFRKGMLQDGGTLIIEHSKNTDLSKEEHFQRYRKYGGSFFSFFG